MRIVFMGTPAFAVPSLAALIDNGYEVVGAFVQPDRPSGRGNKLTACPIKLFSESHGIPVFQFERVRRPDGITAMQELQPDLVVTAAFGQILSQALLDIPRLGTINVHASLLPKHRGAAPINWSIIHGETETGVTTMLTDKGLDTGDILLQKSIEIGEFETAGELTERLSVLGAELLIETLSRLDELHPIKQNEAQSSYEPILTKELGRINFAGSAKSIADLVRGINPWPGAYAMLPEGMLKIWSATAIESMGGKPGEVMISNAKQGLIVACADGALELIEIQAPNAKRMQAKVYLMGKTIPMGAVLNG